jgi:hypothetical protein
MTAIQLEGKDNRGRPRQEYANYIAAMDEDTFLKEAETATWLSAYAADNRRSDYHWHADACYNEAKRRGKPSLYSIAFNKARAS